MLLSALAWMSVQPFCASLTRYMKKYPPLVCLSEFSMLDCCERRSVPRDAGTEQGKW